MSLAEFCAWLTIRGQPVNLSDLVRRMKQVLLRPGELDPFIRFDPHQYTRAGVVETRVAALLVLSWNAGQRSPIHDHSGSACCVRVVRGAAVETSYDVSDPVRPRPVARRRLQRGVVTGSYDRDAHRIEAVENLVTLHAYSPPLFPGQMRRFPDEVAAPVRLAQPI